MSTEATHREIGVGLISVGWMGRLHTRAYKAVAEHYPELGLRARLVIAADTVEATARQAAEVLGYQSWSYWVFRGRLSRPAQPGPVAPVAGTGFDTSPLTESGTS